MAKTFKTLFGPFLRGGGKFMFITYHTICTFRFPTLSNRPEYWLKYLVESSIIK